ncbi:hypothetical protein TWF481_002409 [Arthrobotrys musiformis]|uniref:Clr5 domain-containing protein n=1 Tax=Arthrobotrys musiformis TaxID=47236 RepID=A0AAV9VT68_9PEZI
MPRVRGPPKEQWEEYKDFIGSLYVHQGYTLADVCKNLADKHGFIVEYVDTDCEAISEKVVDSGVRVRKRDNDALNQNVEILCNGVLHKSEKVGRALKRYRLSAASTTTQPVACTPGEMPTERVEVCFKNRTLSEEAAMELLLSTPSIYLTLQIAVWLQRDVASIPSRFLLENQPPDGSSDYQVFNASSFLRDLQSNKEETEFVDSMAGLDRDAIDQVVWIDVRTEPEAFYSPYIYWNVQIDVNFLVQFLFRTVYLINNNFMTENEMEAILELVDAYSQIKNLFLKVLALKSEGARQFRENISILPWGTYEATCATPR